MNMSEMASLMKLVVFCLPPRDPEAVPDPTVRREEGIVYGQAGGAELRMNVLTPTRQVKGRGLLFMISGGFFSNERILKLSEPLMEWIARDYGYTVFGVIHGAQPHHIISEIIPQITRAVRFTRHHAGRFGVDPERLGIMGFSSGALLSLMAGVRGDAGNPGAADPVERTSSRVQAVAAFFPPTDFLNYGAPGIMDLGHGALGPLRESFVRKHHPPQDERALGRAISPRYHVSAKAAPTILFHGDQDQLVPLQQSEIFLKAMHEAGVECALKVKHGAAHGWKDLDPELEAAMGWFDRHLEAPEPIELARR